MPLISGEELYLAEAQDKLRAARLHRRMWTMVTANLGILTADLATVIQRHYNGELSGWSGAALGVGILATAGATLGSFTEILDSSMLVDSRKSAVRWAQRDVEQMEADRAIQPELELQIA